LIYLSNGHDEARPWLSALPGVGAVTLLGLPFTVGFLGLNTLYSALLASGHWALWLMLAGIVVAEALMTGGLLRAVFSPGEPVEGGRAGLSGYGLGLGGMALFAIAGGLLTERIGAALGEPVAGFLGLAGSDDWVALLITGLVVAGGLALWRFEQTAHSRSEVAAAAIAAALRPDWLYRLAWSAIRLLDRLMFNVAAVLEGDGALLWALAVAVAVALVFRG
jgi:hypothetical protein